MGRRASRSFICRWTRKWRFINKLDVATFRAKLIDAETHLSAHVPLLLFDNHDNPRLDMRYGDGVHDEDIQRVLATILFASRARRCSITATRSG